MPSPGVRWNLTQPTGNLIAVGAHDQRAKVGAIGATIVAFARRTSGRPET